MSGEDCVEINSEVSSGWNDIACTQVQESFIEIDSDLVPPTITSVSSDKTNGAYKVGEVIDIDVTFSEAVTSTGSVTVTLETGATDRTCTFTVSNSTTGTCNYTVQSGDTSADLTVSSISGTIADQSANAMVSFTPATNLAANKAIVIDTTVPTVSITAPTEGATVSGSSVSITASASDTNLVGVQFKRDTNTNIGAEDTTSTYGVTWDTTALADGSQSIIAVARDTAGNYATSTAVSVTVDNTEEDTPSSGSSGGGRSSSISSSCNPSDRTVSVGDKVSFDIDIDTTEDSYTFKWTKVLSGNDEDETHKFTEAGKYYPRAEAKDSAGNKTTVNCGTITVEESDDEEYEPEEVSSEYKIQRCEPYLNKFILVNENNDTNEVKKLQNFLNKYENENLDENGLYDQNTIAAVKRFQENEPGVLSFWNLTSATGNVYITTKNAINKKVCQKTLSLNCPYFTESHYSKLGDMGSKISLIKEFLNTTEDEDLNYKSELFDTELETAVKRFQIKYSDKILTPWNISVPSGWWYQSTSKQANDNLGCFLPQRLDNGAVVE